MNVSNKVSVIMYHYVRELKNSCYPEIRGLEFSLFQQQLDYLEKYYCFISMEELIYCYENKISPPKRAVILTFDDGYSDHFRYVFPELRKRKIQGSFFIPAKPIIENVMLDVNKLHFILASSSDHKKLVLKSFAQLDYYRSEYQLESNEYYFSNIGVASRFDTAEVIYLKRLLQKELPEKLRNIITTNLFEEVVGKSEKEFSQELYLNTPQLKEMLQGDMHIGHHGYDHYWLDSVTEDKQISEIEGGCKFLKELGVNMDSWTMCYPYGAYTDSLIQLLQKYNCRLGFTTKVAVANLNVDDKFKIPRLDTNDIPKSANAIPNDWYLQA